jgi:hypothetical protein
MIEILEMGKKRQSISYLLIEKNIFYHNLICSFKGEVTKIKPPPFPNK